MRLRMTVFLLIVLSAWMFTASARSRGGEESGWAENVKSGDGCFCHGGGTPNSATVITVKNWPATFVPGQAYVLEISSTTDVPQPGLEKNQGGFLAWVDKGELSTTPGHQPWIQPGTYSDGTSWVSHTFQGELENGQQKWNFTWTAPDDGAGTATLKVYVNRVNGDGSANSADHWNRKSFTSSEGSGTPTSVFPTPSDTPTTPAGPTSSPSDSDDGPDGTDDDEPGGQQPSPGFVAGAAVFLVVAILARRRLT